MWSKFFEWLFEWLSDIKTLLAILFIATLLFWSNGGKPDRLLSMAEQILAAVFSLAVGYKLGQANPKQGIPTPPPIPPVAPSPPPPPAE